MRHDPWNKLDGIPQDYKKICLLDNPQISFKNALYFHKTKAQYFKGMNVIFRIKVNPTQMDSILNFDYTKYPLIVSNLFRHERKISVNHANVQLHNENTEDVLESKGVYEVHCGFRKMKGVNMMFSRIYNNCDKFKTVKKIDEEYESTFLASFYGQLTFPPNNLIVYS